jgi:hypothetical protein
LCAGDASLPLTPKTAKDMQATSINIQPIKSSSEAHNSRSKELNYVNQELTPKNESWYQDQVDNRLQKIKENYTKTTGQKMQGKATPIREGVVVITDKTTMSQLKEFSQKLEERFGVKTFQIHIHRDEGHSKSSDREKDWKPNLHAHLVFDWTLGNTGKSCKLDKNDMAEMQTILAECLGMERGKSSDVKHLNAIQYKNQAEEERKKELQKEVSKMETVKTLKTGVIKGVERFKDALGVSVNDRAKMELENENLSLKNENISLKNENDKLKEKLISEENTSTSLHYDKKDLERDKTAYKEYIKNINSEVRELCKKFDDETKKKVFAQFPVIKEVVFNKPSQKEVQEKVVTTNLKRGIK